MLWCWTGFFFFYPNNTKNSSLAICSESASCLGLLKFTKPHHWQFIILIASSINEGRSALFWSVTFLLCHRPQPPLLLPSWQMWGDSRSHIDLSTGGGEDAPAVIFPQLLCVWGSAQYCQWCQCDSHVCAWSPALPQVSFCYTKLQ